ncbi:MAG: T9SS type A sorting domain-containing protein [Flavobacteriia bacterium]|jgi:hypothetical protein
MLKNIFISALFICSNYFCFSQNFKGIYIDGFNQILGNQQKEDSLFDYLRTNSFNSISLYNLHLLDFSSSSQMTQLRNFILKAKTNQNIIYVGAVAENAWFFENKILPYNLGSQANEQFNVFNLEFEFWVPSSVSGYYCSTYLSPGGFTCDEAGAFQFYMQELNAIKAITSSHGWDAEIYLGWFDQAQANAMKTVADRIFLSNYNANPNLCFDFSLNRLEYLGSSTHNCEIAALFSSEDSFLNPWLTANQNDLDSAFSIFTGEFTNNTGAWKNNTNLIGQQWFTYSTMNYQLGTLITEKKSLNNIEFYPNPAVNTITIADSQVLQIEILNSQMKSLGYFEIEDNKIKIDGLSSGIYFLKLNNQIKKFIKV